MLVPCSFPPKSSLASFNSAILSQDTPSGGKGNRSFRLWKNVVAVENLQGDAKVSSANEHRKTSAGASQAIRRTRPLQNERTKQGFGTFLGRSVREVAVPLNVDGPPQKPLKRVECGANS